MTTDTQPSPSIRSVALLVMLCTLMWLIQACASNNGTYRWPEHAIKIEQLRPVEPFKVVAQRRTNEKQPSGTVLLRLHVDQQGIVRRVLLVESSGTAKLDEAAMQSMMSTRFEPYLVNDSPTAVTVIAPLHFKN